MRLCESCDCPIEDGHPFAVCPKCLFGTALEAVAQAGTPQPGREALIAPQIPGTAGLSPRRDYFQKYEILERIGGGGQGDLWKVWDSELRRTVAMKILGPEGVASESIRYRFLAEAQIASQLEHPGILPIFDVGLDPEGRPFYSTALLPGTTLGDVWRQARDPDCPEWSINRAVDLLLRVCDVMAHAHSRGVIHRDLKPANVLVGAFGDVRVIDWGSAHILPDARLKFEEPFVALNRDVVQTDRSEAVWGDEDSPLATANTGQPVTVLFTPPEILRGQLDHIGPRTDVYSMGVMLYELLAGRPPYARADGSLPARSELRGLILQGPPAPLRSLGRGIVRDLAAVCEKAMAHEKDDRYPTMTELANDLRAFLEVRPVQARKPGLMLRLQKWSQRHAFYVFLGIVILAVASIAVSVTRLSLLERDAAQQITALRSAELAARSGQWREALRHWDEAAAAGYSDTVHLGMQRAEAWTVLSQPARAEAELKRLVQRSDLGSERGAVLLRLGEHELFEKSTFKRGIEHVREAQAAGLTGADQDFASALLAESTPQALEHFRRTLRLDPYHHGAHRHSLGLELLLGRHQELETHIRVFKVLYPDDPSAGFLEATSLALQGRIAEARARLAALTNEATPELSLQLGAGLQSLATAANSLDITALIDDGGIRNMPVERFLTGAAVPLQGNSSPSGAAAAVRSPQLPCIQKGLLEGADALRSLLIPFLSDPTAAVEKIKSSWRHHPEAWLPLMGGIVLEQRHPGEGAKSMPLLRTQAGLFQLAADSPTMLPKAAKLARFLAAKSQFELAANDVHDALSARVACLRQVRRALEVGGLSAAECGAYFKFALELGDHDLTRQLLGAWEQQSSDASHLLRHRIQLDVAVGAYGGALRHIEQLLEQAPGDPWLFEQRQFVLRQLGELVKSTNPAPTTKP